MNNQKWYFLGLVLAAVLGGLISTAIGRFLFPPVAVPSISERQQMVLSSYPNTVANDAAANPKVQVPEGLNFLAAASKVTPAVVHIKTRFRGLGQINGHSLNDMFNDLWKGEEEPENYEDGPRLSSGSGVIISADGYIATNYHVIEDAGGIEVVLNDKRSYKATLVGVDPTTDLALLKINDTQLPFVPYGDSDGVQIGEWVLAVGNPFDLTSTVTAGIVSAKARNINILRSKVPNYAVEAFIQTDAAVNPGNSGGALVDLNGNLIGINTAIATNTGTFSGYSFAVPVALVRKVMDDLLQFGEVQRALMGVTIQDVSAEFARREGLKEVKGVYIAGISSGGGADDAGLQPGDVIYTIDQKEVSNTSRLQELIARNRPGDQVKVTYMRGGKLLEALVILKNKNNSLEIVRTMSPGASEVPGLGVDVMPISDEEKMKLNLEFGLKVVKIREGKVRDARIEEGFVISHLNHQPLQSVEDLHNLLPSLSGEVLIEGRYSDGQHVYYGLNFDESK